jgi:transposase-like protein
VPEKCQPVTRRHPILLHVRFCERLEVKFLRPTYPYVKVKGSWKYLYRTVDKAGATVDFLLTAKRDRKAALRFLSKAIKGNGTPEKITIDKSGANKAAIDSHNNEHETEIETRQIKYLNTLWNKITGRSNG